MASTHTLNVTGVTSGIVPQSLPPARPAIFDLVKDKRASSLYVQALAQMQKVPQNQVASHFQIGGIHGKPYVEWDGSGAKPISKDWEGYCNHGNVLFPLWHRPYVALYEQVLQLHVQQVAETYTTSDRAQWLTAAANFRLPYWDWAQTSVPPDAVIADENIQIEDHQGNTVTVKNPLFSYQFNPVSEGDFDEPWSQWNSTLRCPTDDTPKATTDVAKLRSNLTGSKGVVSYQIQQATYVLLTEIKTWLGMSNHSKDINPEYASSLERVHDSIHNYVGDPNTNGHMSDPTVAGHDPIFFMHHANVDRLLAMWQAINYQEFVPQSTSEEGNWDLAPNAKIDQNTPLGPFWKDSTTYWTSTECRDTASLGYTYPEFVGQDPTDKEKLKAHILDVVKNLYSGAVLRTTPQVGDRLIDWRARVESLKFALNGSYSVFVFVGDVPANPADWRAAPTLAGTSEVFSNIAAVGCANCKKQKDSLVEGVVYLNHALDRVGLTSFDPDTVVPYLKDNLHWRVLTNGKIVELPAGLPSLNVSVVHVPLHFGANDSIPHRIGGLFHHPSITTGRPGGAN